MTCVPPPPAVNTWDVDAIKLDALAVLRLGGGDVDEGRVAKLVATATDRVDAYVDHVEPAEATPSMITAATDLTVELYRGAPLPIAEWSDPILERIAIATPDKTRWGLA